MGTPGVKSVWLISQVPTSLEPCFYARSIVRMALRRLTEKHFSSDESNREMVFPILSQGYPFYPQTLNMETFFVNLDVMFSNDIVVTKIFCFIFYRDY